MSNTTAWLEAKVGGGRMIDHSGGRFVDRGGLEGLFTPEPTKTWKPVPHSELVGSLIDGLHAHDIRIRTERYCIASKNDARIFGLLELEIPRLSTPEYTMVLGFRGANDQSLAISAVAGARVMICSNLALSGDGGVVVLKKKHTSGLDLTRVVPPAIDMYLEKAGQFVMSIEDMKNCELSESRAKELIYDAFAFSPVMNRRLFPVVDALYFRSDEQRGMFPERTLWSLNNSFTEAVKALPPVTQDKSNRLIGRFFARAVNASKAGAPKLGWDVPEEDEEIEGELLPADFKAGEFID